MELKEKILNLRNVTDSEMICYVCALLLYPNDYISIIDEAIIIYDEAFLQRRNEMLLNISEATGLPLDKPIESLK